MFIKKIALMLAAILFISATLPITESSAVTQTVYYVDAVNGEDIYPGTLSQPFRTIEKARDTVRTVNSNMTGNIYVYLREGTYALSDTFQLNSADSGTNGFNVIYSNYTGETPVISGGQNITGWTLYDADKNIWQADVDASMETRQIYVNGVRAVRARTDYGSAMYSSLGITAKSDGTGIVPGWTNTGNMENWENISDIEFIFRIYWVQHRIGVAGISGNDISMKQPVFDMIQKNATLPIVNNPDAASNARNVPDTIENAYELLDEQGEWYLNRATDKLYYIPRTDEDMSAASVVAAKLETLVNGSGTLDTPIHNIHFIGITFSYATWLRPNGNEGYACIQAGVCCKPYAAPEYGFDLDNWVMSPANVCFTAASNILFEQNTFTHLGAGGLSFSYGSRNNTIRGNIFTDISGTGVQIGGISWNDSHPSDNRYIVKNNVITNNYIYDIAVEYPDCVAIFAGYTENTSILHNEICGLPYTAISVGWGWGHRDFDIRPLLSQSTSDDWKTGINEPTTSKNNNISNNHIYNIMNYLTDGGGIYCLGAQPGTVIEGNYLHDIVDDQFGAIYLDSGCSYINVKNNIIHAVSTNFNTAVASYDQDIEFNYYTAEDSNWHWRQRTGFMGNNYIIADNVPSSILDNVGLQPDYIDLLPYYTVNYALGKSATGYYNDGTPAVMQAEAYRAVDGNLSTVTIASEQYAWTEEVDLGNVYNIDRVVTTFASTPANDQDLWATDYEIQVSVTGGHGNFTTVKTVADCTGGVSEQTFNPVNARYVRIKAIKPDGAGQTGIQMAIAELGVYGRVTFTPAPLPVRAPAIMPIYNLALAQNAFGYYNDGSPAVMQNAASYAVDGNLYTAAIASEQYAWTEEVDLGKVYNINRVKTIFASTPVNDQDLWATDYEIQVSATGGHGNFTTVKTVTNCTGGVSEQSFDPVNARYVRIKAIKPDGPGQAGTQMAIAELEVYEYTNLSYKKAASGYYNDGSPAIMQHPASNGVDGNLNTVALAANEIPWTYQVDLGQIFDIDRIDVYFHQDLWATDFEIQISNTESDFTTVYTPHNVGVNTGVRSFNLNFEPSSVAARYIRIKAIKPDGPGQTGNQMAIAEVVVNGREKALKISELTDDTVNDKCYYRSISNQQFTFQSGDVISYDVKLLTDSLDAGGIDILNTDNTRFKDQIWQDQNGITGQPVCDLREKAYGKWYHREMVIPDSMIGKTSAKWMLAIENDTVSTLVQAVYDNIVVKRSGNVVFTAFGDGKRYMDINSPEYSSHYSTDAPVCIIYRK